MAGSVAWVCLTRNGCDDSDARKYDQTLMRCLVVEGVGQITRSCDHPAPFVLSHPCVDSNRGGTLGLICHCPTLPCLSSLSDDRCSDGAFFGRNSEDMTLFTPDRKETVCRGLSFQVSRRQSVLIFGPSGCGKSSLLR